MILYQKRTREALRQERQPGIARAGRNEHLEIAAPCGHAVECRVKVRDELAGPGLQLRRQRVGIDGAVGRSAGIVYGQQKQLVLRAHHLVEHLRERVYDDYAHNPEKLRAMWLALAERHPGGICVVWRPHGYAPLRKMMDALAEMFDEVVRPQDKLLLLPVYDAGGTT
ncbi:MAG: hypothetical protein IKO55_06590, partial [Kiritimatiellae bacterium]|nr:hypothetical protein [Kiritimatiellia bacterium]